MTKLLVVKQGDTICPDGSRTVLRPFRLTEPAEEGDPAGRTARAIERLLSLRPEEVEAELAMATAALRARHYDAEGLLAHRFADLAAQFAGGLKANVRQARLIGLFFSEEFAVEAAALFNPSVVAHFDQGGLADGDTRLSIGVQKGPPIGVQKGPPLSSGVTGMAGVPFALVAA